MTVIQVILFLGLIFIGIYVYRRFRNAIIDALIIIAFIAAGIILVLFPELTNKVAHALGVGRGADLVFYLSILFFFFIILKLYARIRRLEESFTKMIRENSIASAKKMEGDNKNK